MHHLMIETLTSRWNDSWRRLGVPAPSQDVFTALIARWAEPHRKYHTLQHLEECLALFASERSLAEHPGEVAIALWFHDAVYDTRRHDNEAASAQWARQVLLDAGADAAVADRLHGLIMATRHSEVPSTPDAKLLVDIDLAILGAEPARFAEYERQIRDEYGFVPQPLFRDKRAQILRGFLQRPAIFATQAFADRFDRRARANLARAIAQLG